jgi:hypothetical protein
MGILPYSDKYANKIGVLHLNRGVSLKKTVLAGNFD